ncbi:MAG: peptidylprolyl isomerase, partial [Bacteroidota bacterium]|nr:peptidylprolyl isomerase [Bacteroidota bacterium]
MSLKKTYPIPSPYALSGNSLITGCIKQKQIHYIYFMKKLLLLLFVSISTITSAQTFTGKPQYEILTKRAGVYLGTTTVELFPAIAPNHVKNFDSLVSTQFYDSTAFHRVIPGFMIQGGDPNSRSGPTSTWGLGDSTQPTVNAEFSTAKHIRGTLSAARDTDINSANSQFFICVAPAAWLNGTYSVYGHVTAGMDIVDSIVASPRDSVDNPLQKIEMFITYTGSNDSIPVEPVLNLPLSGSYSASTVRAIKWFAVSDAIIYHVEVSTDSLFS